MPIFLHATCFARCRLIESPGNVLFDKVWGDLDLDDLPDTREGVKEFVSPWHRTDGSDGSDGSDSKIKVEEMKSETEETKINEVDLHVRKVSEQHAATAQRLTPNSNTNKFASSSTPTARSPTLPIFPPPSSPPPPTPPTPPSSSPP